MSQWRPSQPAVDRLVSLLAALFTANGSFHTQIGLLPHAVIFPLAVVQGLILLARRRRPVGVLAGATIIGAFLIAVGYPAGSAIAGACCAAYAVAMYWDGGASADRPDTPRSAVAALVSAVAAALAAVAPDARVVAAVSGQVSIGVPVATAWILGYAIRTRRAYIAELRDRAARLEAEEGRRAERAVADERLRIARELHDVIGHAISLITVQSEAAARSARTSPDAVPGFLATISATSRQALAEMRHVLAVLRPDAQADLSPQPGLEALPELVARLADGGLKTRLDVEPLELPPGIGLAVYRIVQESLTNVLKHAGADARAGVTVAASGGVVRVSVHDDGVGPCGPASSAAHGIVGMRERAAVYGGTLRTGPRPAGGFEVEARIPLPEGVL